jgi:hypothetical protein
MYSTCEISFIPKSTTPNYDSSGCRWQLRSVYLLVERTLNLLGSNAKALAMIPESNYGHGSWPLWIRKEQYNLRYVIL